MLFTGHGGPLRAFLQHHCFDILAKLTYGAYLWSLFIMTVDVASLKAYPAFTSVGVFWDTLACTVLGFGVAYISYITVECPMAALQGWVLGRLMKPSPRAQR